MKKISIITCTLEGDINRKKNLDLLISDLRDQTVVPDEMVIVSNSRPRTKAHNRGVKAASGEIVFFLDDDLRLPQKNLLEEVLKTFANDPQIGIVGVGLADPPGSNKFQLECTRQLLQARHVGHGALAMPKRIYEQIGDEDENLEYNDDGPLNFKVMKAGYKITHLDKSFFVYHPQPLNLGNFMSKCYHLGRMQHHDYIKDPSLILNAPLNDQSVLKQSTIPRQIWRNVKILFKGLVEFRWILIFLRISQGLGFFSVYFSMPKFPSNEGNVKVIQL